MGNKMQLVLKIKKIFFEFCFHHYHGIYIFITICAMIGFGYTAIRGVIYLTNPIGDAYYTQHYQIFKSKINAKNYLRQFLPKNISSELNIIPKNLDTTFLKKENINRSDLSSWSAEQNISKKFFDNRIQISYEEYRSIEIKLKKDLIWNRNFDGYGNRYLSEELQKKYDFSEFIDLLYSEFSKELIDSVDYLSKKADKNLPLNSVVYKKITGPNVGLPVVWFYRNLASSVGDIDPMLQQQNSRKEHYYTLAYKYFMTSSFFLGILTCCFFYFFKKRLTKVRRLVFYDGNPM
jgi:hypothetical protein